MIRKIESEYDVILPVIHLKKYYLGCSLNKQQCIIRLSFISVLIKIVDEHLRQIRTGDEIEDHLPVSLYVLNLHANRV